MSFILFPNFYISAFFEAVGLFFYLTWVNVKMDVMLARLRFWTALGKKFDDWGRE